MTTTVLVYSDYVCPFCYIAEQSSVVRLAQEFDVEVDWRGFELHPETPPGGMLLTQLFPAERVPAISAHLAKFSASFGLDAITPRARVPNTRRILAATEFAREHDTLDAFRDAAMKAYWRDDADLEDDEVIRALAVQVDLDADGISAASVDPTYLARIDRTRRDANKLGVDGIPTFFIGQYCIVGCQPYDVLSRAARLAGAVERRSAARATG